MNWIWSKAQLEARYFLDPPAPFRSEGLYPMVRWLESNGYDVSYTNEANVDQGG